MTEALTFEKVWAMFQETDRKFTVILSGIKNWKKKKKTKSVDVGSA